MGRVTTWSEFEDQLLIRTLEEWVADGYTKEAGFRAAANLLQQAGFDRTTAICEHRWRSILAESTRALWFTTQAMIVAKAVEARQLGPIPQKTEPLTYFDVAAGRKPR